MSDFTELEKKILREVMERRGSRVADIAARLDCSVHTIYQRLRDKPEFREAYQQAATMGVVGDVPGILDAFSMEALAGSFQHGKLLLEIAGVYEKKQRVDAKFEVRDTGPIFDNEQDKREYLRATLIDLEEEAE